MDDHHAFAGGRAVVVDQFDVVAEEGRGEFAGVCDGRRAEDERRVGPVELADTAQAAEDVREMAPEDTSVGVHLVDDDVLERFEQLHPLGVVGEDGRVQHVRVREHDVAGLAHRAAGVSRGVAVVGKGANVGLQVGNQPVQFVELVLGEGLRREEIERAGRGVLEDRIDDRDVVAEGLPARRRSYDHGVLAGDGVADGGRLVAVGVFDAALAEGRQQPGIEVRGPCPVARRALIDAPDVGLGRLAAKGGDHLFGDDRRWDRPDSGDRIGRRRLDHGRLLCGHPGRIAQMFA